METSDFNFDYDYPRDALNVLSYVEFKLRNLIESLDIRDSDKRFNYAQAKFSYPLYSQKIETISELYDYNGNERYKLCKAAERVLSNLTYKIMEDFDRESEKISHANFLRYVQKYGYTGKTAAIENALCSGDIDIIMFSNHRPVKPVYNLFLDEDFMCIRQTDMGPKLLHKWQSVKIAKRDFDIKQKRKNMMSNKEYKKWIPK